MPGEAHEFQVRGGADETLTLVLVNRSAGANETLAVVLMKRWAGANETLEPVANSDFG